MLWLVIVFGRVGAPLARGGRARGTGRGDGGEGSEAGFTLVELLISLLLLSLALALAAQVMMEGAQMLTDAAAEQADAPMPLVAARLRGDIRAATGFEVLEGLEGPALFLDGHPAGLVVYQKIGDELRRTVLDETGKIRERPRRCAA